jgi:hypothetical protein
MRPQLGTIKPVMDRAFSVEHEIEFSLAEVE